MPDHLGGDMRKVKDDEKKEEEIKRKSQKKLTQTSDFILLQNYTCFFFSTALDEGDIALLKTYVSCINILNFSIFSYVLKVLEIHSIFKILRAKGNTPKV